jgi:hypothetical protein
MARRPICRGIFPELNVTSKEQKTMPSLNDRSQIDPDREIAYRRGYIHGVNAIIDAVREHLAEEQFKRLEIWSSNVLGEWTRGGRFEPPDPPAL